jgi:tRNA threonylcarbamoyladenosine biosynthesis protein TsaE
MTTSLVVKNEKEMARLGAKIGKFLCGGEVLELVGQLGAGKTTLAKAIIGGAGGKEAFSPTFVLNAVHPVAGRLSEIHHLDLYRLKDKSELITLGLYDTIGKAGSATIIEWADRFPNHVNTGKMTIEITISSNQGRHITFKATDSRHEKLLQNISNSLN